MKKQLKLETKYLKDNLHFLQMKNFLIVTVTFLLAFTSTLAQDINKDWLLVTLISILQTPNR